MKVSVIIPTWNRIETLKETVGRLRRQNIDKVEILVIDDGSDEKNLRALKAIRAIKVFYQQHKGPAAARNLGIKKALGDILIFINDDTWTKNGFISTHIRFHKKNTLLNVALLGPLKEHPKINRGAAVRWLVNESGQHFNYKLASQENVPWYYFWTCNISVKRDFLIKNNLFFDESFPTAAWEDIEFAYRAKNTELKLFYDKNLVAFHYHEFSFDDVIARFYSHGRGLYHLEKKLPNNFLPPLARGWAREVVKVFIGVIGYKIWRNKLISWLKQKDKAPNTLMQLIVLAKKIEGFDYERNKLR